MTRFPILALILLAFTFSTEAQGDITAGESLYKSRCASCHQMNAELVGPAVKDAHKRYEEDWLISYIQDSRAMVASGDSIAVALFNRYNGVDMPPNDDFSADDVRNILAYVEKESERIEKEASLNPISRPKEEKGTLTPLTWGKNPGMFIIAGLFIIALFFIFNLLTNAMSSLEEEEE